MKIKFWGVRGSIPSPGPATVRYGGNTTCIEVRTDSNGLIVLDGGTGIFPLSQSLFPEFPLTADIFITHTHWDHIQGLPFFIPVFIPGNEVRMHGALNPVSGKGIEDALAVQLQYSFFPIREAELKATIRYKALQPAKSVQAGSATVTPVLLNHPVVNMGYRVDCNGKSMFFTGDHEPAYNIYEAGDEQFDEYKRLLDEKEQAILDVIRGVDVLIADAAYTPEEYPDKKGWGHGTFDSCIQMARKAGAKKLYCTHHEPTRCDDALEKAFEEALARNPSCADNLEILLAREGQAFEW